jgi:hypothetical protein
MAQVTVSEETLRQMLREAVAEALDDRRELLHDVIADVLEDIGLAEAIREGRKTERVDRETVFAALDEHS